MDTTTAHDIALRIHAGQRDRFGGAVVDHLSRVAASVVAEAQPVAWLHDAAERTEITATELRVAGMTSDQADALELLTRTPTESYELYTLRIAYADGEGGRLARMVKLADLDDHIAHRVIATDRPPYDWARRRIATAQARQAARGRHVRAQTG